MRRPVFSLSVRKCAPVAIIKLQIRKISRMDTHENQLEKGVLFLFGKRFVNGVSAGKKLLIFMDTHYSLVSVGSLGKAS